MTSSPTSSNKPSTEPGLWRAAGQALRATFTRPLALLPAAMAIAAIIGILVLAAIALVFYVQWSAPQNTSYFTLVYAVQYTMAAGAGTIPADIQIPDAFLSPAGLATALAGVWTWQYAGLAAIFLIACIAIAFAYGYARALIIGLMRDAIDNKRTNIIGLFRAGRQYWMPSVWYSLPFLLLAWLIIVTSIPLWVADIYYQIASTAAPLSILNVVIIVSCVLFLLLSGMTVLAEGTIAAGSRSPVMHSAVHAARRWKVALGAIGITALVTIFILILDFARSIALAAVPTRVMSYFLLIVLVLIVIAWRVWATAFAVALVPQAREENRT